MRKPNGICGKEQTHGSICTNAAGCRVPHATTTANKQAAVEASRGARVATAQQAATSSRADLLEATRSAARSQFERMCKRTLDLDDLLYGVRGQSSINFEQLRNAYALAERCADDSLASYNSYGIDALSTLGHYAQIEADAKAVIESRPMRVSGDQRESALRLAEHALSELSESGGPLNEAVGEARRRMMDVKEYVADYIVQDLGEAGIAQIAQSEDPEAAIAAVFEETLREARAAFDEEYGYGEQIPWAVVGAPIDQDTDPVPEQSAFYPADPTTRQVVVDLRNRGRSF